MLVDQMYETDARMRAGGLKHLFDARTLTTNNMALAKEEHTYEH